MTRWDFVISDDDMNRHVLSRLAKRAVRQAVFWKTVESIWERNRHLSGDAVQSLADEAVAQARKED